MRYLWCNKTRFWLFFLRKWLHHTNKRHRMQSCTTCKMIIKHFNWSSIVIFFNRPDGSSLPFSGSHMCTALFKVPCSWRRKLNHEESIPYFYIVLRIIQCKSRNSVHQKHCSFRWGTGKREKLNGCNSPAAKICTSLSLYFEASVF